MALAALKTLKCTGTNAGTETDVANHGLILSSDSATDSVNDAPIKAPQSAQDNPTRSYECWLRFELTAVPDSYIQNIKVYGPSNQPDYQRNPPNKVSWLWGTSASGVTPVTTNSTIATGIQHSQYYSAGTALAVPITTGNSRLDAVGEKTGYFVSQMKVDWQAQQGLVPTAVWNLTYEEV